MSEPGSNDRVVEAAKALLMARKAAWCRAWEPDAVKEAYKSLERALLSPAYDTNDFCSWCRGVTEDGEIKHTVDCDKPNFPRSRRTYPYSGHDPFDDDMYDRGYGDDLDDYGCGVGWDEIH